MDILSDLETVKADYEAAQTLLAEAATFKNTVTAQLAEKETALSEALASVASKDSLITDLTAADLAKDGEIAELKTLVASLKQAEVSAEAKAVEIVASQGIAPVKYGAAEVVKPASRKEVLAQWQAITNAKERAEFYGANKAIILGK